MSEDSGYAPPRWEFDEKVTDAFDDMLERSIPQYQVMRDAVTALALRYSWPGTTIVDLGCSRGQAMAPLVAELTDCDFVGAEVSGPMLAACRDRFQGIDRVSVQECDLRTAYPKVSGASVTMAVLSLQFVPIEYRQRIIRNVYRSTAPGGVFILVEKVLGATSDLDVVMVDEYLAGKADRGYSQEAIDRKRLSLEGVLVPVKAAWNEDLLRSGGFTQIDSFWRWMNFAGWIAIKE